MKDPYLLCNRHVLADIFSRLKYMERRGSGFKKIVSAYKGQGYGDEKTYS